MLPLKPYSLWITGDNSLMFILVFTVNIILWFIFFQSWTAHLKNSFLSTCILEYTGWEKKQTDWNVLMILMLSLIHVGYVDMKVATLKKKVT